MSTPAPTIYFAGSIRGGRDDAPIYSALIDALGKYGRVLTEHIGGAELTASGEDAAPREIHDRDLGWIKSSDFLVAEVTTPSLGVGYEIARATEWRKPVLCLFRPNAGKSLSGMIAGCPGVTVREYTTIGEAEAIFEGYFAAVIAGSP